MSHRFRVLATLLTVVSVVAGGCATRKGQPPADGKAVRNDTLVEVFTNREVRSLDPVKIQTGRYSYVPAKATAEQINPLLTIIDVRLPGGVRTIEQAVTYLLARSGYRLADLTAQDAHVAILMGQPIADSQRHLGPITLQDALLSLGGPAFRLLVDPVRHEVAYDLHPDRQVQYAVTRP